MIKIDKDLSEIPKSLTSDLTCKRREELIENEEYIYQNKYDSRYKTTDIKRKLRDLYNCKCAFCEQKIERFDVEHFRPKNIYYWLAYSWDNLLLACPTCNGNKQKHFETLNEPTVFAEADLEQIHHLADRYNELEGNQLIHPEKEDIELLLEFDKDGSVLSMDERVSYTIEICQLDRNFLNDERKKIWDGLKNKMESRFFEYQNGDKEALIKIKGLVEDFKKDAQDLRNTYIAFRKYVVRHFLLETDI